MARCIELAKKGSGNVSPNPMVGCVIVCKEKIIGEGYHKIYGGPHAEVNAINSVQNQEDLKNSTIYVSLEPCAHFGLTPPCSDLIISKKIPNVVIGSIDPFAKVAGKGIEKLKNAGCDVKIGILKEKCDDLNKRFFTYHSKKRPFIILKWAQTMDGFIDIDRTKENYGEPTWITGQQSLLRVHQLRAREDAIMVGTNTAEKDNPSLTVRNCEGNNPLRIVLDQRLRLPAHLALFDNSTPTLVFNAKKNQTNRSTQYIKIDFQHNFLGQILQTLHEKNILSVIVEGGKQLLETFIESGLWDEAHVYTGNKFFNSGIQAPEINMQPDYTENIGQDTISVYKN